MRPLPYRTRPSAHSPPSLWYRGRQDHRSLLCRSRLRYRLEQLAEALAMRVFQRRDSTITERDQVVPDGKAAGFHAGSDEGNLSDRAPCSVQ